MKVSKRQPAARVIAKRITSPETQLDRDTGKRIMLLSFADESGNQVHKRTVKALFQYVAGTNEEGELPTGLDRLAKHKIGVHLDEDGRAVGLDIAPSSMNKSRMIPSSELNVDTMKIRYDLDGAVARVVQRPFNTPWQISFSVIKAIDDLIAADKPVTAGVKLGTVGTVVDTDGNSTVEVRLRKKAAPVEATPVENFDDAVEG
jgi:hypothetical protein